MWRRSNKNMNIIVCLSVHKLFGNSYELSFLLRLSSYCASIYNWLMNWRQPHGWHRTENPEPFRSRIDFPNPYQNRTKPVQTLTWSRTSRQNVNMWRSTSKATMARRVQSITADWKKKKKKYSFLSSFNVNKSSLLLLRRPIIIDDQRRAGQICERACVKELYQTLWMDLTPWTSSLDFGGSSAFEQKQRQTGFPSWWRQPKTKTTTTTTPHCNASEIFRQQQGHGGFKGIPWY